MPPRRRLLRHLDGRSCPKTQSGEPLSVSGHFEEHEVVQISWSQVVLGLLQTIHSSGLTILLVTHDPVAAAAAGRTVEMQAGRMADDAPAMRHVLVNQGA